MGNLNGTGLHCNHRFCCSPHKAPPDQRILGSRRPGPSKRGELFKLRFSQQLASCWVDGRALKRWHPHLHQHGKQQCLDNPPSPASLLDDAANFGDAVCQQSRVDIQRQGVAPIRPGCGDRVRGRRAPFGVGRKNIALRTTCRLPGPLLTRNKAWIRHRAAR